MAILACLDQQYCNFYEFHQLLHQQTFNSIQFYFLTVKTTQREGFHLDIEDYLMGLLQMASELVSNGLQLGHFCVS